MKGEIKSYKKKIDWQVIVTPALSVINLITDGLNFPSKRLIGSIDIKKTGSNYSFCTRDSYWSKDIQKLKVMEKDILYK
jgi:hypothetical protein